MLTTYRTSLLARHPAVSLPALVLLLLACVLSLAPAPGMAGPAAPPHRRLAAKPRPIPPPARPADWQAGQILVRLAPDQRLRLDAAGVIQAGGETLRPALTAWGLGRVEVLDAAGGLYRLHADSSGLDVAGAVHALAALPGVVYAEPDYRLHAAFVPSDPLFSRQWALNQVGAPAAWDITTGSADVIVAMIDTGIAPNHPDLVGKLVPGYNFVADTTTAADDNGHGTYTAGLVGALSNNNIGVAGVAWATRIMPVKILDKDGAGNVGDFSRGIHFAVDHGAKVINISAGIEYPASSMQEAVRYARDHGVLVVASAGNTPDGAARYPAGFDEVVAVSATDEQDKSAAFSSYGAFVDLAAPGVNIVSTGWGQGRAGYTWASGTSSAAPLVTGAAALLLAARPDLTPDDLQRLLEDGADDLGPAGWDPHYGAGRLNILRSLQIATGATTTPPSPTVPPAATATPVPAPPKPTATPALLSLVLNPAHVLPGGAVTANGRGYQPGEAVGLRMTGPEGRNHELGTAQVGADGSFQQAVTIPADLTPGTGMFFALGALSNALTSAPISIDTATQPGAPPGPPGPATGSRIEGTISGVPLDQVQVYLQVGNGVRDWRYGSTDNLGFYHFDNLPAGDYTVGLNGRNGLTVPAPVSLSVDGQPGTVRVINFDFGAGGSPPVAPPAEAPAPDPATAFAPAADPARSGVVYFPPVQHTLRGVFLAYWQQHGGLPVFGYPLSEEFVEISDTDGKPYRVQYFERNRFEYHPEYAGTPNEVLLGLLGRAVTLGRTFAPPIATLGDANHAYFPQTGHMLGGAFLAYWRAHGGLAIFGYPISEEFTENGYTVQYFERNRFEFHPEYAGTPSEVLLGLLGVDITRHRGFIH
jgi:subtilisin family serine protease